MDDEEEFVGCISCMGNNDLCDLFGSYATNVDTYAQMLENCFGIKVTSDLKFICSNCVEKLEKAVSYKEQTLNNIGILQTIKDEEYLDESILEQEEAMTNAKPEETAAPQEEDIEGELCEFTLKKQDISGEKLPSIFNRLPKKRRKFSWRWCALDAALSKLRQNPTSPDEEENPPTEPTDDTTCIYCELQLNSVEEAHTHIRAVHGLEASTGKPLEDCPLCGVALPDLNDHLNRCHGMKNENEDREYPCHFCENVYKNRKACFTHLRMKHGLKLYNDNIAKSQQRERKKCHKCARDFSQKQILNKHLLKAHGIEVEKRKAFLCPLCDDRVSYGTHFSEHLLHRHRVTEQVEQLEFENMGDFFSFKQAIQDETKYRFRKISASRQVMDGTRSNYMCSQSGVYVYQGKGKRPAPERQIYKTGKACPAHMIVTETIDRVLVTFYKTHVGHGPCPYYEPREPKKPKISTMTHTVTMQDIMMLKEVDTKDKDEKVMYTQEEDSLAWVCDLCGLGFLELDQLKAHSRRHGPAELLCCRYCDGVFENIEGWTHHMQEHHSGTVIY